MGVEILRPAALVLLLVLPLLWWWHRRSIAPLRGPRRVAALTLRCLAAALLVFALSEPRWLGESTRAQILMLVDRSHSVGENAVEAAQAFAEAAEFDGALVGWIDFAGSARVRDSLEELADSGLLELDPSQTRIDGVLGLAQAGFRPGRVRTGVLFSDGVGTGGEPDVEALATAGIRMHTVEVAPPDRPEVLVRDVSAPDRVRANEPVRVDAVIQSNREGPATVDFFRNGVRVGSRPMTLQVGANPVSFDDRASDERLLLYEVGVRAENDTLAENNLAGAAVLSDGEARVLLVTDVPDSARHLEWALRQEGIDLSVRPSSGAPDRMSDLQNFDAVIVDNVAAADFSLEQMELLRDYVRDFGGGLLMLGGDNAYGLGGYHRTPVEDALPVQCDYQREEESPSLGLALVIDRSGSMSGEPMEMAKAAAQVSVDLLSPQDYVSVIVFDSETNVVTPMQPADSPAAIAAQIASITASGGTNMAPAMEEGLRQVAASPAKIKHVIVLTDGVSTPGPFFEIASVMVSQGITLSTVALGSADTELLTRLAATGNGRAYETQDASAIPQIFMQETMVASKSAIQEFPFLAKPLRAVDFLEGVPWTDAPFLLGYVRVQAKPTSETWLVTERGDPLLSTWRFGLGTTAAFTSDARNRWAVEWLRWPGYGKFWAQLMRRIARPAAFGLSESRVEETENGIRVTMDAMDPDRGFPSGATATLNVHAPNGTARTVEMEQLVPGRWVAEVPVEGAGITVAQARILRGEEPVASRFFTHTRSFSREYLLEEPDSEFLAALASATGGSLNPDPSTIFLEDDRHASAEHDLWPWLALLALCIFVADVAVRRWPET